MNSIERVIAIGDIHGCAKALDALLDCIAPQPQDLLVCLGDLIDTGDQSAAVLDRLIKLRDECQLICLLGNHEEMLLGALDSPRILESWLVCGGIATLNSYFFGADLRVVPAEHLTFLRSCREYFETDTHLFVHANYDPQLPLKETPTYTLRWELLDEIPAPHQSGKRVIVGHTEQRNGEVLDHGHVVCIDTAVCGYGWLTGLDVQSGQIWQTNRWGAVRDRQRDPQN